MAQRLNGDGRHPIHQNGEGKNFHLELLIRNQVLQLLKFFSSFRFHDVWKKSKYLIVKTHGLFLERKNIICSRDKDEGDFG